MSNQKPHRFKSIAEYHQVMGLPKPEHPLISVIDFEAIKHIPNSGIINYICDFYCISLKKDANAKMKYGQQKYDYDEGAMLFMSPGQVFGIEVAEGEELKHSGWLLLIHPDFLWYSELVKKISHYEFFGYAVNEALFLSEKEEKILNRIIENIQQEYHSNIDKFSKQIIISHIETLLNYSERFYNRQFITREKAHHQVLECLENLLTAYFSSDDLTLKGLPTVQYVAEKLNVSQSYLGSLLRTLTGQNTQQHIHIKLIEKAKEKLSTTNLTISEIAYELGFEHSQAFSRLFKSKANQSPLEFRQSFN